MFIVAKIKKKKKGKKLYHSSFFRLKLKAENAKKKFNFFNLLFIFLFLISGFLIFTNINIGLRRMELVKRINFLRTEVQTLEEKNRELKRDIARADTKDFLEERAREELGFQLPGEEVVVISPIQARAGGEGEGGEENGRRGRGFWQEFWNWLMPE